MTKPVLSQEVKEAIAQQYTDKWMTQSELATIYCCSVRTIRRALIEMGVLQSKQRTQVSLTKDELAVHEEAKRHGLKPGTLTKLMSQPALSRKNVELYLSRLPTSELTKTINTVTAARKVAHDRFIREQRGKAAANG